jgi:hypothetical protein
MPRRSSSWRRYGEVEARINDGIASLEMTIIEDYASVTPVAGAAFGREPLVTALFAGAARSYGYRVDR